MKNRSSPDPTGIMAAQEFDTHRERLRLDGIWQFAYDPDDLGIREQWFRPEHRLPGRIRTPGCAQSRRHRSAPPPGAAFAGLPELDSQVMLKYPCHAPSWYKRRVHVPAGWSSRRIWLHLGGVKPAATIWIDGRVVGRTQSSRTPVRCDVSAWVQPGQTATIALRFDWDAGCFHGVFDILSSWSGMYRSAWMEAVPAEHLVGIHVRPFIHPRAADVEVTLRCPAQDDGTDRWVAVQIRPWRGRGLYRGKARAKNVKGAWTATLRVAMPGARLWSPDKPWLYLAEVQLVQAGRTVDNGTVRFGLREVAARGFHILLNRIPVYLRGGCDDQLYAETVCPPADKAFFLKRLRLARKWGFNYSKSATEIFTREYLDAADEVGMMICEEMPFLVRDGIPQSPDCVPHADAMHRELANIVRADRNHPSVVLYSMSSELSTPWLANEGWFRLFSRELPALTRSLNPGALVADATGVSAGPDLGRHAVPVLTPRGRRDTDVDGSWLKWALDCRPLAGPIPGLETVTTPFLFHEFAWITALSDPVLIRRYCRLPLKPLHVPEMVAAARSHNQGRIMGALVRASRQLKYALRKQALELARREPKSAGYHHWLIHDFPFCAEGVFNDFWEEPGDLTAREFRACNADTVLCLEHGPRWTCEWGDRMSPSVLISHFGAMPLDGPVLNWSLRCRSHTLAQGARVCPHAPRGSLSRVALGPIALPSRAQPGRLELRVTLRCREGRVTANHWSFWAFPPANSAPATADIAVVDRLTKTVIRRMEEGGRVLLLNPGTGGKAEGGLLRAEGDAYRTVPYNMGTTGNMGTLVRRHPALGGFPHDGWCDFAWVEMIDGARPFDLAVYGTRIDPIIRSIGHMRTMQDKGYLFEVNVGRGRLLACGLRVRASMPHDPAARYLNEALIRYLGGTLVADVPRIAPIRL